MITLNDLEVKDVMSEQVECVLHDGTLTDAAAKMKEMDVGALPVVKDGDPVGLVTDRDIVVRAIARGADPRETRVSEVMSADVRWCEADDPIGKATGLMQRHAVRRLLVRDGRKLAGIVSLGDVAEAGENDVAGRALSTVCSEPSPSPR